MTFKTNDIAPDSLMAIEKKIQEKFPDALLEMNTESADNVLHVHGVPDDSLHAAELVRNIEEAGFKGAWLERGLNNR